MIIILANYYFKLSLQALDFIKLVIKLLHNPDEPVYVCTCVSVCAC